MGVFSESICALMIYIQLGSGLFATTVTAFWNVRVNVWAYVVFGVYLLTTFLPLYYTSKRVCSDEADHPSVLWIAGACTVCTSAAYGTLYFLTFPPQQLFEISFYVFLGTIVIICVALSFMSFLPELNIADIPKLISKRKSPQRGGGEKNEKTLEESLIHIVNHVKNTPSQNLYHLVNFNGDSFTVTM